MAWIKRTLIIPCFRSIRRFCFVDFPLLHPSGGRTPQCPRLSVTTFWFTVRKETNRVLFLLPTVHTKCIYGGGPRPSSSVGDPQVPEFSQSQDPGNSLRGGRGRNGDTIPFTTPVLTTTGSVFCPRYVSQCYRRNVRRSWERLGQGG